VRVVETSSALFEHKIFETAPALPVVSKIRRIKGKSILSTFHGKTAVALRAVMFWKAVRTVSLCLFRLLIHHCPRDILDYRTGFYRLSQASIPLRF
jgi:hypothetical protein